MRKRAGLTQARLARLGGTSQPAIAAYEAGARSPNLNTIQRLARAADLDMVIDFIPALTREDRRSLALHSAIAEKLRSDPGAAREQARKTLLLMRRTHPNASAIFDRWAFLLDLPDEYLVAVLVDPRPLARELRHATPFAGVLNAEERRRVYERFAKHERKTP
ncbi:MAG: helix-turn-helix transcriptional regulator [Gemmatimonadota bacterium]